MKDMEPLRRRVHESGMAYRAAIEALHARIVRSGTHPRPDVVRAATGAARCCALSAAELNRLALAAGGDPPMPKPADWRRNIRTKAGKR